MEKFRVLQVIGGNEIGGAEEHVLALCSGLDKDKFSPFLVSLCQGPLQSAAEERGIAVTVLGMKHPLDLSVIPQLVKLIKTLKIDIVHTHGSRANLTARLAARWLNVPIVTTMHSSLAQDYLSKKAAWAATLLDRLTMPLASRVITISNFLQPEAKGRGAKRTVTIYNGIDPARFSGLELLENIYLELGIEPGTPLVGTIGRLHPVKGHNFFLEAAQLVSLTHPGAKFLVVGSGPLEQELRQKAAELNIADKVLFTGYYPEIQRVLKILDVLCLPSISEGMGLVLLEAMFFGKPVVASSVGGVPELVRHEENGLLVPPGDPILMAASISRLLDDKALAARLGANGQRRFKDFSLDRMLERTQKLYQEILQESELV